MSVLKGFDLLHQRVSLLFQGEDQPNPGWFDGTVSDYHPEDGLHRIVFDDGDKRWLYLEEEEAQSQLRWPDSASWPTGKPQSRLRRRPPPPFPLQADC